MRSTRQGSDAGGSEAAASLGVAGLGLGLGLGLGSGFGLGLGLGGARTACQRHAGEKGEDSG